MLWQLWLPQSITVREPTLIIKVAFNIGQPATRVVVQESFLWEVLGILAPRKWNHAPMQRMLNLTNIFIWCTIMKPMRQERRRPGHAY